MELHPIIPVSIDDTISLKRNTTVFSLAAGTVIIPYTTIVWSVKLQQHPKTVFVVIRVLRGILEQNILAQFSLHKIIPPVPWEHASPATPDAHASILQHYKTPHWRIQAHLLPKAALRLIHSDQTASPPHIFFFFVFVPTSCQVDKSHSGSVAELR